MKKPIYRMRERSAMHGIAYPQFVKNSSVAPLRIPVKKIKTSIALIDGNSGCPTTGDISLSLGNFINSEASND